MAPQAALHQAAPLAAKTAAAAAHLDAVRSENATLRAGPNSALVSSIFSITLEPRVE